jgi:hypothetical protein
MRVMVIMKATADSEAELSPTDGAEALFAEMGRFNEALVGAGMMLAGDGLHPSRKGHRVVWEGGAQRVVDGPFAETKELIAGFWIWKVPSMEEALAWAKRIPNGGKDQCVELRQIYETEDFGDALSPELRAREEQLRIEVERQAKGG